MPFYLARGSVNARAAVSWPCRRWGWGIIGPMIILHHLENSRSQRVLWLLEELALPYEVKRYERDKKKIGRAHV